MGFLNRHSLRGWLVIAMTCLVAAWAGYLVGAQRSFGRLPYYTIGQPIAETSRFAVFAGWSTPEAAFRWSEGRTVAVVIRPRAVPARPLVAELDIALAAGEQAVTMSLNGTKVGHIDVPPTGGRFTLPLPPGVLRPLEDNVLTFDIADPRSPGASDPRMLGIALRGLRLREA